MVHPLGYEHTPHPLLHVQRPSRRNMRVRVRSGRSSRTYRRADVPGSLSGDSAGAVPFARAVAAGGGTCADDRCIGDRDVLLARDHNNSFLANLGARLRAFERPSRDRCRFASADATIRISHRPRRICLSRSRSIGAEHLSPRTRPGPHHPEWVQKGMARARTTFRSAILIGKGGVSLWKPDQAGINLLPRWSCSTAAYERGT